MQVRAAGEHALPQRVELGDAAECFYTNRTFGFSQWQHPKLSYLIAVAHLAESRMGHHRRSRTLSTELQVQLQLQLP